MAFTQTQLETLEAAVASGVLTVKYADRTVTYQSLADMMALLNQMRADLAPSDVKSYVRIGSNKGFC